MGVQPRPSTGPEDHLISSSFDSDSERREYGFPTGSVFRAARDAVIVMGADGRLRDIDIAMLLVERSSAS